MPDQNKTSKRGGKKGATEEDFFDKRKREKKQFEAIGGNAGHNNLKLDRDANGEKIRGKRGAGVSNQHMLGSS